MSRAAHPKCRAEDWEQTYLAAWQTYYTNEHMETVFRRLVQSMPGEQRHPA